MSGRKRKFPRSYVVPDGIAEPSETPKRRVGHQQEARHDPLRSEPEFVGQNVQQEAEGEHGANTDEDGHSSSSQSAHNDPQAEVLRRGDVEGNHGHVLVAEDRRFIHRNISPNQFIDQMTSSSSEDDPIPDNDNPMRGDENPIHDDTNGAPDVEEYNTDLENFVLRSPPNGKRNCLLFFIIISKISI